MEIKKLPKPKRVIANRDGRFFPYINKTELDLSQYQIFNQTQAYDETIDRREHCLIEALSRSGVSKAKLNAFKLSFETGCNFRKVDLKIAAKVVGVNIVLHQLKPDGKISKLNYKCDEADEAETVYIAIHENHYFKFEDTKYNNYFISNYNELKDEEDCYTISRQRKGRKTYERNADAKKINSLLMVNSLMKAGQFEKLDMVRFEETSSHQDLRDHICLDNMENEQRLVKIKEPRNEAPVAICFADCESFVDNGTESHKLYLMGMVKSKDDFVHIYNVHDAYYQDHPTCREQALAYRFLDDVTSNGKINGLVYFHNLKYDYHLLGKYLNIKDRCEKDGQIYNVIVNYKNRQVELRDSYKLLPFPLAKFQREFNLPAEFGKREAINYCYYTNENNNKVIKTEAYINGLSRSEKEIFRKQVVDDPSYNKEDQTFNPLSYYKSYLELDCLVLKKGIQQFREHVDKITDGKMDIYECLTISGLTDEYFIGEGAYEGVAEVMGNLRAYIAKAIYGGRVCSYKS